VDTFHEAYATRQMFPEMRMGFAVLIQSQALTSAKHE
jgi:hypothetical protein